MCSSLTPVRYRDTKAGLISSLCDKDFVYVFVRLSDLLLFYDPYKRTTNRFTLDLFVVPVGLHSVSTHLRVTLFGHFPFEGKTLQLLVLIHRHGRRLHLLEAFALLALFHYPLGHIRHEVWIAIDMDVAMSKLIMVLLELFEAIFPGKRRRVAFAPIDSNLVQLINLFLGKSLFLERSLDIHQPNSKLLVTTWHHTVTVFLFVLLEQEVTLRPGTSVTH